jgi:hypothetical protein
MIYWVIFGLLFVMAVINQSKVPRSLRFLFLFIATLLLVLLAGLRGDIEPDYSSYKDIFEITKKYFINGGTNVEYGYLYINYILSKIGFGFQSVIFLMSIMAIIPKIFFFYKQSPNYLFSILIYYSSIFFLFDFIAIRQAITISIFMWSLFFVLEKKFIPYLLTILLGSLIHSSILILIPCYFIFSRNFSSYSAYILIIVCTVINFLQIKLGILHFVLEKFVLPDSAAGKVSVYGIDQDFAFVSLKQICLAFIFVFINSKKRNEFPFINILTNVFVMGIFFSTIFNSIPQLAYRIKWYFFWTESILILYFIDYIYNKKLSIKLLIYTLLFVLYANSLSMLLTDISSRGDYIYPYKIFIEELNY